MFLMVAIRDVSKYPNPQGDVLLFLMILSSTS